MNTSYYFLLNFEIMHGEKLLLISQICKINSIKKNTIWDNKWVKWIMKNSSS